MDSPVLSAPPTSERGSRILLATALAAFVVVGTLAVLDQLGPLFLAAFGGGQLPLIALAALGRLAPRAQPARWGAVGLLYLIGVLLAGFTFALAAITLDQESGRQVALSLGLLAWGLLVLLLAPVVLLLRPVRVRIAGWLPLDPDAFHHWIGLVALLWFITMPIASLPVLGGRPPLEALLAESGVSTAAVTTWYDLLYGLGWTVMLCLIAAGFPMARSLQAALVRLGLTWPGWRGIAVGVVVSVLMVPLLTAVDQVATGLVESFGLATTSSAWIDRLFGRDFGVLGALAAALSAGLGEELVWRGVIQTRYGLGLAALGFAAMHGFQYGPDGLISVFLSGLVLGLLRSRTNTTVAAVAHGGYDFWLFMSMVLGW
jgi:membrane protease YdiL (CAAX protease family)